MKALLRRLLPFIGAAAFLVGWELLSYGQVSLFFNKVFVAYRESDPLCQGVGGAITHGAAIAATGNGGAGENESVSYQNAPRTTFSQTFINQFAASNNGGCFHGSTCFQPPAAIKFSPATVNAFLTESGNPHTAYPYPGACLQLCTQLGYDNETGANIPVDTLVMEVFKFLPGSNPLDPASTPPVRTFTFSNIGEMLGSNSGFDVNNGILITLRNTGALPQGNTALCAGWDGSFNVEGEYGRTNGDFGFRVSANVHRQSQTQGNITIQTSPPGVYPGMEKPGDGTSGLQVGQVPITVDVADVHFVRSTPSVVGQITAVAAQPYNLQYRLSKDATMFMQVLSFDSVGKSTVVRDLVNGLPRVGEGIPNGTLTNGDFWDGRDEAGQIEPPGVYTVRFQAQTLGDIPSMLSGLDATNAPLPRGADISEIRERPISLDPLQITDIRVGPLTDASTSLATLTYVLTEDATTFIDIYSPETTFVPTGPYQGVMTNYNNLTPAQLDVTNAALCPAGFQQPSCLVAGTVSGARLERSISEVKRSRVQVLSFWDGRDQNGRVLEDGDYPFLLYGQLPSMAGQASTASGNNRVVWTSKLQTGFLSVIRGLPTSSQVTPQATIAGSAPAVGGLEPFSFRYTVNRDSVVSLKIFNAQAPSGPVVRTIVNQETRAAGLTNAETWVDGRDDNGLTVSSGVYIAQLTIADPFFPQKVSTVTASFPVDMFRITDVATSPLLSGASDVALINYLLTEPMKVTLAIYPPGTVVNTAAQWPPCGASSATQGCNQVTLPNGQPATAVDVITGFRPRRLKVTEFWDGRDGNGNFVADGNYVFTLIGESTTTPSYVATDKIVGSITIARGQVVFPAFQIIPTVPALVSSSETITLPPFEIDYVVTRQSSVTIQALTTATPPSIVRTILAGGVREANILNRDFWDGRDDGGNFVAPGFYTLRVTAKDLASNLLSGSTVQQTVAVDSLRIYDVAVAPVTLEATDAVIAYQVSEAMKVSVKIFKPGTHFDPAGNPSPPEAQSLVRRIVTVKPARTPVQDLWDGRDFKLTLVPDGNYLFKIIASTDLTAIDSFTGNARPGASLAQDTVVAEVAVVRGGSKDPEADFIENTAIYPNPARDPTVTFEIHVPVQANVSLKLFNLAGEMVRNESLGTIAGGEKANFVWKKDNAAGRRVAHGVYFAVIREEGTLGDQTVLQTVKKILIP